MAGTAFGGRDGGEESDLCASATEDIAVHFAHPAGVEINLHVFSACPSKNAMRKILIVSVCRGIAWLVGAVEHVHIVAWVRRHGRIVPEGAFALMLRFFFVVHAR